MNRWHLCITSCQGCWVEFGREQTYVGFAPNQFGKIISVCSCGYVVSYIPIYNAVTAVLAKLPKPHRFGSKFSPERGQLCRKIVCELNHSGYKPVPMVASKPGDIPW